MPDFLLHQRPSGIGAERLGKSRESLLHVQQEDFEVFFTAARS
jgi:hypothetical protein